MPKSFLVKKKDVLIISTNNLNMDTISRDMEKNLERVNIKVPASDVRIRSSLPRERDSLHKFAISKMLGITEDDEDVERSPKKLKVDKVDENCNRLSSKEAAFDLSLKPPTEGIAMVDPTLKLHGSAHGKSQRSPNGSPSEPPKVFEPFPWIHPIFHAHPQAFPSYFPMSMRLPGLHSPFPYPPIGETCFGYKPFPGHLTGIRSPFLPPHHSPIPGIPVLPLPSERKEKLSDSKGSDTEYHGKLMNSAFDPVISNYSIFPRDKLSVDVNLSLNGKKKDRDTEPTRYHCDGCSKVYATFSGLSKHKQFHCASQVKKEFSCKYCDKTYVSLGALKMHIRTHTLPCKCKLCGKAFSRPWLLQGHIRTHTGEKPFRCDHCARAFADRSNLRAHLQTHSEIKKYSCKACNKTFSRMSLLLKHEDNCCINHAIP